MNSKGTTTPSQSEEHKNITEHLPNTEPTETTHLLQPKSPENLKSPLQKSLEANEIAGPSTSGSLSDQERAFDSIENAQAVANGQKQNGNNPSPRPQDLLIKLKEKADKPFIDSKKKEVTSNPQHQTSSGPSSHGTPEAKHQIVSNANDLLTAGLLNSAIAGLNNEVLQLNYLNGLQAINFPSLMQGAPFDLHQVAEMVMSTNNVHGSEKVAFYRDGKETLGGNAHSNMFEGGNLGTSHGSNGEDRSEGEIRSKGGDVEDRYGFNRKSGSHNSSESKVSVGHLGGDLMLDENVRELLKGAAAKKKKFKQCYNRLCTTDSLDPNLWVKQKFKNGSICKVCHEAYKKQQYCVFCCQIYFDGESNNLCDEKEWIECEKCNRWNHIECEHEVGLRGIKDLLERDRVNFHYFCGNCRTEKPVSKPQAKKPQKFTSAGSTKSSLKTSQVPEYLQYKNAKISNHPKPMHEERHPLEDGLEEVITKKLKVEVQTVSIETGLNGDSSPSMIKEEKMVAIVKSDFAQKKLDSMFHRNMLNKKKYVVKPVTTTFNDTYNDIDKLMGLYGGGKKFQFSESEITNHLDCFRQLSTDLGSSPDQDLRGYLDPSESRGSDEDKKGHKNKNKNSRKNVKGRSKNFYAEADPFNEDESDYAEPMSAFGRKNNYQMKVRAGDYQFQTTLF